ncbi:molybdopterin-guanine dinucleotide biosynthesis protein A [Desulfitispora alkaliphila]|uniref:molybdenum cofactor guanylyltransferase n=1 Tax=Desulfitispora alkaliphila TaxID=622674 RepID=UPI003D1D8FE0
MSKAKATGVILSGGKNSRMGRNKAFLTLDEKKSFIEKAVDTFNQVFDETIIVTNEPNKYENLKAKVVTDIIPQKGPLSGIHAGLVTAQNDYAFTIACDMPFVNRSLIELLVSEAPGYEIVVPQMGNYLQPLHAVYHKKCIKPIEQCLKENIKKIIAFYPWVKINFVSEEKMKSVTDLDKVFFNVNDLQTLEKAKELYEEGNND